MSLLKPLTNPSGEKSTSRLYRPLAFSALKDAELVAIYNVAPVKKVAEGALFSDAETQQDCCYVVISGSVRLVSRATSSSKPLVTLGRGEWFGKPGSDQTLPYTVIAAEPTTVMQLSAAALQQLPDRVQNAINAGLSNSIFKSFRVVAESADEAAQKIELLSNYAYGIVESRIELTKAFVGRYLSEIPKLPPYVSELAEKLLDERTTPKQVADGINQDPSLAALVLQTVNSPRETGTKCLRRRNGRHRCIVPAIRSEIFPLLRQQDSREQFSC